MVIIRVPARRTGPNIAGPVFPRRFGFKKSDPFWACAIGGRSVRCVWSVQQKVRATGKVPAGRRETILQTISDFPNFA
jgi:hypothetical protein